ncbi:alkaline phosphatase family protein [Nisaea acidiphila]|uniref:Alkaline phosphatase family protein n=1 Tax=Nisaea acidiphila TaxID=1862145 RepID=A0A9J7ASG0_9PROT|nr:alkaline phosphatase family protein [Nisaea acidiphila]UUX49802.1 alkaline phosphatase family protein [Nisaea acidiphila]
MSRNTVRNILFVMCDQLRWDYLSCAGHPHLQTPHIDALAARGVRFDRAYCQSPICGPSRMSFYTGRFMFSHGAGWNNYPLRVDEWTLGDYLRPLGMRVALAGKTHMKEDTDGMARLGLDPVSEHGVLVSECGFEPYERDDGLHPDRSADPDLAYNRFLRQKGYRGDNPWSSHANSTESDAGETLDGWYWGHSNGAARVRDEDSETPYMTDRAIDFITEMGDKPWCLHLSYIKPHWPYIAPEPYASMYGSEHILPVQRNAREEAEAHPVYAAFMRHKDSMLFRRPEARETIVPAYMGLIKQIDDQFGRLMKELERLGRLDDTMIVFTSDHGDYLGDHWLGEKDLFHEASVRIPLIVYDPRPSADATRGTVSEALVEAIDLVPTFVEAAGGAVPVHRLEGRSLQPLLDGRDVVWRTYAISESDYSGRDARADLNLAPMDARCWMLRTDRWKYVLHETFRPQLYDLEADPGEFVDLGADPACEGIRAKLKEMLFDWFRNRRLRVTISDEEIVRRTGGADRQGILIGYWKPSDP